MSCLFTVDHLKLLIKKIGTHAFFQQLIDVMQADYAAWDTFDKMPRIATHYPNGVIELMPISNAERYAFKYVNGHPENPDQDKLTVAAVGMLADATNGYPLLISEMTILTAFRTAAASALASKYLARDSSTQFGLIGTGAQAEFQTIAHQVALGITDVFYFDIDEDAMRKYSNNMQQENITLHPCHSIDEVVAASDLITTATADKSMAKIIKQSMLKPGLHINAIGGDCPGKTELDAETIVNCKIVVQYLEQALVEGEIQHLTPDAVYAELWELVVGDKAGREHPEEITLFDSVGFAIEDYSVLRLVYDLVIQHQLCVGSNLLPHLNDPKDLFSILG